MFKLSICIPTFNRADYILKTLSSLVNQHIFLETDDIEIVISDNNSSDNTFNVVNFFKSKFGNKISYFKNNATISAELNIFYALNKSNGLYKKLINDTAIFNNDSLKLFINIISDTYSSKPVIFFNNCDDRPISLSVNFNDFIAHASYQSTWIGSFGIWANDLKNLNETDFTVGSLMPHTKILFNLINIHNHCNIHNFNFCTIQNTGRKSGYNIAEVFGQNYLNILEPYLKSSLKIETFTNEKKKILINHIIPFYFSPDHDFLKTGFFKFLHHYKDDDFFFPEIENYIISRICK